MTGEIAFIKGEKYKVVSCTESNRCTGCYFDSPGLQCEIAIQVDCGRRSVILKQIDSLKKRLQTGMVVKLRNDSIFQSDPYLMVIKDYHFLYDALNNIIQVEDVLIGRQRNILLLKYWDENLRHIRDKESNDITEVFWPIDWTISNDKGRNLFEGELNNRDKNPLTIMGKVIKSRAEALKILNSYFK